LITLKEVLKILQSYNINSQKYGPTIYKNKENLGICIEIKDKTFGFLTRAFTFENINSLDNFLKMYFWYKNNHKKYNIELSLDKYDTPTPKIKYIYNNEEITLDTMLNLDQIIENKKEEIIEDETKEIYIKNIEGLTNYLIEYKKTKDKIKNEKNNLKTKENDLKYELLQSLSIYYGKEKNLIKKPVSLEIIKQSNDIEILKENLKNIKNKEIKEIEEYLKSLINIIKEEELDDKNLVNIYSNSVYKYNIEILNKQIDFVKSKIEAEKNFNLKGSKIHNIDEELKSFLKTNIAPIKIEIFLEDNKNNIRKKHEKITDIKNSYFIISGHQIELPKKKVIKQNKVDIIKEISQKFDELNPEIKSMLILYNSFYKDICNYIINNNYPDKETIKKEFHFDFIYNELEKYVFNENNSHYLNTYFRYLNFKNLDTYIDSIINICKIVEKTYFNTSDKLKAFYTDDKNKYKSLTINPIYKEETSYLVEIPNNIKVLYIPDKIELDEESKELNTITTKNLYINKKIIKDKNTLTLNKYYKKQEKDLKNDVIITTDLELKNKIIYNLGKIEGESNE